MDRIISHPTIRGIFSIQTRPTFERFTVQKKKIAVKGIFENLCHIITLHSVLKQPNLFETLLLYTNDMFIFSQEKVELVRVETRTPQNLNELVTWTQQNPGRFSYPKPPDFLGLK